MAVAEAKREPADVARATILAAQAAIQQSEGALRVAQINLANTVIQSPIKGVILARRVNVGQNVAPDPKAPSLFLIAKDLAKLHIRASVNANEVDISQIHEGADARFTVQDFPKEVFKGKVAQIRPNAALVQNVAPYTVVVTFDNSNLKLRPYMTANIQFEAERAHTVFRVPMAALNWNPRPDQVAPDARESAQTAKGWGPTSRVWVKDQDGQHVRPLEVQLGWWHEGMCEISGPEVKEGMEVIVGLGPSPAATGTQPAPAAKTPAAPLSVSVSRPVVREISDYAEFPGRIEAAPAGMTVQQDSTYVRAIYVAFDVDERTVLRLRRAARQDAAKGPREPDYAVLCAVTDEVGYPHRGKLASTGESVDPATGTAHWRG